MASRFPITYLLENEPGVQARIRRRFSKDIGFLKANGFQELCFYGEQMPPLSWRTIRYLPIAVLMFFGREVLHVEGRRQVTASFLLLLNRATPALALPMGMGIKLYTPFEDGFLLVTTSFPVWEYPRPGTNVEKQSSSGRGSDVWTFHRQRVAELEGQGSKPDPLLDFDRYIAVSNQEEAAIL